MKLTEYQFDFEKCQNELIDFKSLLDEKAELEEQADILKFFKTHIHFATLIGSLVTTAPIDAYKLEFDMGDFRADLSLKAGNEFILVEFEDAKFNSIFKGDVTNRAWSDRIEHSISQIIDWYWFFNENQHLTKFREVYGTISPLITGLVIVGRNGSIRNTIEKERFDFRKNKTIVNSYRINLFTYDEIFEELSRIIKIFSVR